MTQLSTAHQHYEDSLDLVHTALCLLPRNDSALVRSELLGLESRVHAHLGNHSKSARAADACFETWQEADGQAAPDWLHYMNQVEVHCLVTNTYVELALHTEGRGQALTYAQRAEQHSLSAQASRAKGYNRSRILDEIRLAKVRLAQHEVAEAVTVGHAALGLAASTSSTVVRDWLVRFHRELASRYPGSGYVMSFSAHLHEYMRPTVSGQERNRGD